MFKKRTIMLCFAPLLCLPACSNDTGVPEGYPPKGAMRVISTTPLEIRQEQENLILNGDFSEWLAGQEAPLHFIAPSEEFSTLRRVPGEIGLVEQVWAAEDRASRLQERFRVELAGFKPATCYRMTISAETFTEPAPVVNIFERAVTGENTRLGMIELEQGSDRQYEAVFQTDSAHLLVIVSNVVDVESGRVIWKEWRMEEVDCSEMGD